MPIVDFSILDYFTRIATWKVNEREGLLLKSLKLSTEQMIVFNSLTPKRKREFLGIRACLDTIGLDHNIMYHPDGKPYIEGSYNISLSHSHGMVTVGASSFDIGVDIELERANKIYRVKDKFIREDEDFIYKNKNKEKDYLHIIWGIKESLYKIDNGNLWSFTNHYKVEPFNLDEKKTIICWVINETESKQYYAHFKKIDNYYLSFVLNYPV